MDNLTSEYLWERFDYLEGKLYWKSHEKLGSTSNYYAGKEAGTLGKRGYIVVKLEGKIHPISRLIFCMHNGYMPIEVDHKDTNKLNNYPDNLRDSTRSDNCCNRNIPSTNTSGYKNIRERNGKYQIRITRNGKTISKTADTIEQAVTIRNLLLEELHGEFANKE